MAKIVSAVEESKVDRLWGTATLYPRITAMTDSLITWKCDLGFGNHGQVG